MPKDNLTILGERLRAARNKANLTQEQLSDRSHVSTNILQVLKRGKRTLLLKYIKHLPMYLIYLLIIWFIKI